MNYNCIEYGRFKIARIKYFFIFSLIIKKRTILPIKLTEGENKVDNILLKKHVYRLFESS